MYMCPEKEDWEAPQEQTRYIFSFCLRLSTLCYTQSTSVGYLQTYMKSQLMVHGPQ